MSEDEQDIEVTKKAGLSIVMVSVVAVVALLAGFAGGTFAGPVVLASLGMSADANELVLEEVIEEGPGAGRVESTFEPMDGVFDPDKKRFYADVGEFLATLKYRGATHYLQVEVQLVGHDAKYMKLVDNDVPAIRNGLLVYFNQQDYAEVSTPEGRESLRRSTLNLVNQILGADTEDRVADVYFTDYKTM